jgi:hypothetical protein
LQIRYDRKSACTDLTPVRRRRIVRVVGLIVLLALRAPSGAVAQTPSAPATGSSRPFEITDNSFLVEEAFNQEPGVFQNIFNAIRVQDSWAFSFIQEWPVVTKKHQLSYTLAWAHSSGDNVFGDTLINYRHQILEEGPGRPAFAPRFSVILPTASNRSGDDATGFQINLPFSKQTGDIYWHWNAGLTWMPSVDTGVEKVSFESPFFAGSAIVRLRPMLNVLMESVLNLDERVGAFGSIREKSFTLSPGVRGGWNIGEAQLILGFAVPMTWTGGDHITATLLYFSYELPFKKP